MLNKNINRFDDFVDSCWYFPLYLTQPLIKLLLTYLLIYLYVSGITGTVSIDANGDRNGDYSLLDMDPDTERFQVIIIHGAPETFCNNFC